MSDLTPAAPATGALQFDTIEPSAAASAEQSCAACQSRIEGEYHMANLRVICTRCREALETGPQGTGMGRVGRAALFGVGAALAGCALYLAVLTATGREISLISIVVGWMVGRAVSVGSDRRGGWLYQGMAVALAYLAICTSYVPQIVEAWSQDPTVNVDGAAALYIASFIFSLVVPFLSITVAPLGTLIVAIGLFQAWRENKRPELTITGPYTVATSPQPQLAG